MEVKVDSLAYLNQYTRLKRVSGTRGGEWAGACPFCGGKDRFHVQPNRDGGRWSCRQCSPHWQDLISFVMLWHNAPFKDALQILGIDGDMASQPRQRPSLAIQKPTLPTLRRDYACFDLAWQKAADDFCNYAWSCLRDTEQGKRVYVDYLIGERSLTPNIVGLYCLGYNPTDYRGQWGKVEVYLPAGIVIPWQLDGYWSIRVRRLDDKQPKYAQAKGSANALYYGAGYTRSPLTEQHVVILTEGEFDAQVIRTYVNQFGAALFPVATGSATWGRTLEWVTDVSLARLVLLAQDADEAGDNAAAWWKAQLGDKARRLRPTRHDVTDMANAGDDLFEWVKAAAPELEQIIYV